MLTSSFSAFTDTKNAAPKKLSSKFKFYHGALPIILLGGDFLQAKQYGLVNFVLLTFYFFIRN